MKLLQGLIAAVCVLVGLLVGWLLPSIQAFRFGPQVDPGAVVGAVATLIGAGATFIVAYLISYLYTDRASSKKADTDLLLEILREIKVSAHALQESSVPYHMNRQLTSTESRTVLSAERELSNAVFSFASAIIYCPECRVDAAALRNARGKLKDSLTDSPFPGPFDAASRNRIAVAFRDMRDELNRLSFAIIRR